MTDIDRAPDRVRVHLGEPFAIVADVTPAAAAELGLRARRARVVRGEGDRHPGARRLSPGGYWPA